MWQQRHDVKLLRHVVFSVIYMIWSVLEAEFLQFIKFYIHQPFILPKTKQNQN